MKSPRLKTLNHAGTMASTKLMGPEPTQRNTILTSGERFSYLENEAGLPDYWTTLFVTVELRSKSAQNTILSVLGALRHLKLWEDANERDLVSEFAAGKFPTPIDIEALYEHVTLKSSEAEKSLNIRKSDDVISMQIGPVTL